MLKQLREITKNASKHTISEYDACILELKFIENMLIEMAKLGISSYSMNVKYPDQAKEHFQKMGLTVDKIDSFGDNLTFDWYDDPDKEN